MQPSAQSQSSATDAVGPTENGDVAGAWIATCPRTAIDGTGARGFEPRPRFAVILIERADQLYAYRDLCPHYGKTRLAWKRDAYMTGDKARLLCSAHGAEFDPITGDCVLGACLGQRLASVPVRLTDDGMVELWVPDTPSLTL